MRDVILKRFNYFDPQHVELITDEPGSLKMPTRANIMAGLAKMVKAAKEGDVLLFHFSGHGVEADMKTGRKDDAIVPCDLNLIYDVVNNIGHLLTGIFRDNVSLKFGPSQEPRSLTEDEGILLSGCQADELSLDLEPSDKTQGKAYGAFTYSLQKIINETNGTLTKKQLVMNVRDETTSLGFHEQDPCLYCSDKNAGTAFLATIP
ncbi:metacaspase-9-like, partial [Gossypium hirsutum]|uniref:Metacaspase-9-like n=1 Tax=Gossypium hirsutum TaxID=3635 RepID=A0A1U8P8J1_GOSHI